MGLALYGFGWQRDTLAKVWSTQGARGLWRAENTPKEFGRRRRPVTAVSPVTQSNSAATCSQVWVVTFIQSDEMITK